MRTNKERWTAKAAELTEQRRAAEQRRENQRILIERGMLKFRSSFVVKRVLDSATEECLQLRRLENHWIDAAENARH